MSAELIVRPNTAPMTWEVFKKTHRVGSIALDGYVSGAPQFDYEGPYLNANHHEDVNRLATLSTAQQIQQFIRMGMEESFKVAGEFSPKVYVNDCDQDVCAAWFLLNNIDRAKQPTHMLNRFLNVAGTLDVTAGAYPYPKDLRIIEELAWVFEPYTDFRASDDMAKKNATQYRDVIDAVETRIARHLEGAGKKKRLETDYEIIGGGENWKMIREIGKDGKIGAFMDGINAYVIAKPHGEERWRYSIGRRSEFVPFDVPALIDVLNKAEGCTTDRWGGADIVGGSPRINGSALSPDQLQAIINAFLAQKSA